MAERIAVHTVEHAAECRAECIAEHTAERNACPLSWLRTLDFVSPCRGQIFAVRVACKVLIRVACNVLIRVACT